MKICVDGLQKHQTVMYNDIVKVADITDETFNKFECPVVVRIIDKDELVDLVIGDDKEKAQHVGSVDLAVRPVECRLNTDEIEEDVVSWITSEDNWEQYSKYICLFLNKNLKLDRYIQQYTAMGLASHACTIQLESLYTDEELKTIEEKYAWLHHILCANYTGHLIGKLGASASRKMLEIRSCGDILNALIKGIPFTNEITWCRDLIWSVECHKVLGEELDMPANDAVNNNMLSELLLAVNKVRGMLVSYEDKVGRVKNLQKIGNEICEKIYTGTKVEFEELDKYASALLKIKDLTLSTTSKNNTQLSPTDSKELEDKLDKLKQFMKAKGK